MGEEILPISKAEFNSGRSWATLESQILSYLNANQDKAFTITEILYALGYKTEIKAVTLASRPIFYDELTKSKLFAAIYAVSRATLMVMMMLQKYAGKIPSQKDQKLQYSS